ncbi:polysaccharide pyruvyl transferase family protein [Rhodococcus sp. P1Y]|uniref:polysaccharide pyruvyl transferase family protein n=1 Tax=Rhodococcus sp. P1Y TaxID=1302308 RepID=UPI00137A666E|nr:polysaccharide pyruvyl transferase family protein [Rhodococcus sp. P1Y]
MLQKAECRTTVICNSAAAFSQSLESTPQVTWIELPGLLDRGLLTRIPDAWKFHRIARRASQIGVIGADVMDGRYFPTSSIARCSILAASQRAGQTTAVFGFSWSAEPVTSAVTAMRYLGKSQSTLYVRDPISRDRLVSLGVENTVGVADLVFSLQSAKHSDEEQGSTVVVNVSGLVSGAGVEATVYVKLVDELVERGYTVLVLPHVIRPGDSDLDAQAALRSLRPPNASVDYIDRLLDPLDVKAIVRKCRFVVTGRMHLGILSLSEGVPAAIINTNGKAEGLYSLFELPNLSIELDELHDSSRLVSVVSQIENYGLDSLVETIKSNLPKVTSLSAQNFTWMEYDSGDKIARTDRGVQCPR